MWNEWGDKDEWYGEEEPEEAKGTSSKDSSYIVISSVKNTPQSNKAEDQEIGYVEALTLLIESNQRTVKLLLNASKDRGASEAEKLDQEDQSHGTR